MAGGGMAGGAGMMAGPMRMGRMTGSPGESSGIGLKLERHIAGFSIRKEDGTALPLIFEAGVGKARDTVILELSGVVPEKSFLWYGYGMDAYCNLTDGSDMAVPVFGPIALDEVSSPAPVAAAAVAQPSSAPVAVVPVAQRSSGPVAAAAVAQPSSAPVAVVPVAQRSSGPVAAAAFAQRSAVPVAAAAVAQPSEAPIKVLIITGDNVSAHNWQYTSRELKTILEKDARIKVGVTMLPSRDLTDENLAKYDVLLLNYKETPTGSAGSRWSDSNKAAFLKAVHDGKGLVAYHFASSAFTKPNWEEFEKAVAGGWRAQGFHGPAHVFTVKKTDTKHPISDGLPAEFEHSMDELYQNSMIVPGSVVLATAFSDPQKPRGTGKDEPVIWVNSYGKGRVYENVLGHDTTAMGDPKYQHWLRRGVIWAGTGKVD
jgi:type 1 glutamine amidotransferase